MFPENYKCRKKSLCKILIMGKQYFICLNFFFYLCNCLYLLLYLLGRFWILSSHYVLHNCFNSDVIYYLHLVRSEAAMLIAKLLTHLVLFKILSFGVFEFVVFLHFFLLSINCKTYIMYFFNSKKHRSVIFFKFCVIR